MAETASESSLLCGILCGGPADLGRALAFFRIYGSSVERSSNGLSCAGFFFVRFSN